MQEHIDLSIPAPCHEKWEKLTSTEKGRHCSVCQKEVIDFTRWTEDEILTYFRNNTGATCGRFRKDQLRAYSVSRVRPGYRLLPLSVVGVTLLLSTQEADASVRKRPKVEAVSYPDAVQQREAFQNDTLKRRTITGIVKAEDDQYPLPGVSVMLKGSGLSTVSDADGKFTIAIPDSCQFNVLVFSFIGLETVERTLGQSNELLVTLKPDAAMPGEPVMLGAVCIRRWTPRGIWWRIKSIFR